MRLALRAFVTAAIAATAITASTTRASPSERSGESAPLPGINALAAAADREDCETALRLVASVIKDPSFNAQPASERNRAFEAAVSCALKTEKPDLAYAYASDATTNYAVSEWLWRVRLGAELRGGRIDAALTTVEAMADRSPNALNSVRTVWFFELNRKLEDKKQDAARRRLLTILTTSYQPDEVGSDADLFRKVYAELLINAGDQAGAAAQVKAITNSDALISFSIDPRFRAMFPAGFDPRAAVERSLSRARMIADQNPGSLDILVSLSRYLRQLGRAEEALALLETARPIGSDAREYDDLDNSLPWWWDSLSSTYVALGREGDAVAALRSGADMAENGQLNVSQTINLSQIYLVFGHPEDALTTIAAFDKAPAHSTSPFGAMQMRLSRGCAHAQLGHKAAAAADLAYARKHESEGGSALSQLLQCMGDLDGAAAVLIRRLDDPNRRAAALLELSDYDPPLTATPHDLIDRNLQLIKRRPDVKAAIERAGGTRRFHLQFS